MNGLFRTSAWLINAVPTDQESLPLELDGGGVDYPNKGREGNTDGTSVPDPDQLLTLVWSWSTELGLTGTYKMAPPRKAKVEPTYIGSEKRLNGKPVTRADMRIPK